MTTNIKDKFNHSKFTIAISLTTLIAVVVLVLVIHGTVSASVVQLRSGIDLSGQMASGRPEGVWSDGSTMWVVDNNSRRIVAYNRSTGDYLADKTIDLDSSNGNARGIWATNGTIWVSDWDDTKLYAYGLATGNRLADRDIDLAGSNDAPRGISGLHGKIMVVDKDDTYVYAYSANDGSRAPDADFDLTSSNDAPWGIWASRSQIWVTDLDDDALYAYNSLSGAHEPSMDVRLTLDNGDSRGIWADGETMWIVDDYDKRIHAIYYRHFRHTEDEIDISAVNNPRGVWTDGETMWVVDAGATPNRKVVAYRMSDGTRDATKDTVLSSDNRDPVDIWLDGTYLRVLDSEDNHQYVYVLGSDDGVSLSNRSGALPNDMDYPKGICMDDTVMFIADPGKTTLYAYGTSVRHSQPQWNIKLHPANESASGVWCDDKTIWVLDSDDAHVYAYRLNYRHSDFDTETVYRKPGIEFRLSPHNRRPGSGFTGHGLRFWVADPDDDLLYAYGRLNTTPSFPQSTVEFLVHDTIDAGNMVGFVPSATDEDGDDLTYSLEGTDAEHFTIDGGTGSILIADSPPNFQTGNEYSVTVYVSDGKSRLDGEDDRVDDAIGVTIRVMENGNPRFNTADGTIFTVDEDMASGNQVAQLHVDDPDQDPLTYEVDLNGPGDATQPFFMAGELLKLKSDETLDYERYDSYDLTIRVKDGKDDEGEPDGEWDDSLNITVQVTNVDEPGEITLNIAQPVVGTQKVATLTDPDGIDLDGTNQITWVVEKSVTKTPGTWTEVHNADTSTKSVEYTPVADDAENYLRFTASYLDSQDDANRKTVQVATDNTVSSDAATNHPPVFTDGASATRELAENAAAGANVGASVAATDDDTEDTLTYGLAGADAGLFSINASTGQISLGTGTRLDYESISAYSVTVRVRDNKDADRNADTAWDAYVAVAINVTNVDEPGVVVLTTTSPQENVAIGASLTDPDGDVSNLTWQWQWADSNSPNAWTAISGQTYNGFVPTATHIDKRLRAQASYDDGAGTGKNATSNPTAAVTIASNGVPEFNEGSNATRSVEEGAPVGTPVGTAITATDPDDDDLTYTLAAGGGSSFLAIDPATGKITVTASQSLDYETNASHTLTVQVSDGKDASHVADSAIDDTIAVTINLVNVDEPGLVSLDSTEPEVGTAITATLTDPDGGLASQRWQWSKSDNGSTNWEDISGASARSYTPNADDAGMYLRATVTYTDGEGSGKFADAATSRPVPANETQENASPGGGTPQQSPPNPEPDFYDRCLRDERSGSVANCGMNSFAAYRVELDGRYTINWAAWDAAHPGVTGYTIFINEFVYKTYYDGDAEVRDHQLADVYESCAFVDDRWKCEGKLKSNYAQDMGGNPTQVRIVAPGVDQTELTHVLEKPGKWMSDQTYQQWSGDAADPNNEPTDVTYRRAKFEMDLYFFQVHGGSGGRETVLVNGANGFDEQPE